MLHHTTDPVRQAEHIATNEMERAWRRLGPGYDYYGRWQDTYESILHEQQSTTYERNETCPTVRPY